MLKKPSIMELFNDPDYDAGKQDIDGSLKFDEQAPVKLRGILKCLKPVKLCEEIVENALKAQKTWRALSPQQRTNILYQIWEQLKSISELFNDLKNDLSLFVDYFDFYCDILLQTEGYIGGCRPQGVVLLVTSDHSTPFAAAATVPAALAAGCSVIAVAPETLKTFLLLIEATLLKSGLPEGVFKVVTASDEIDSSVINKISKVFICDLYSGVQKFYTKTLAESFNFFSPNNTAALILESADINAVADKIIAETWGKKDPSFAVSNIVVQESIYQEFFDTLKYKMNQFMVVNKHSLKFKNKNISEKMQKIISKAINEGALVEEVKSCGDWNPTIIVNHQNQDPEQDVPVLKLLVCRTAKEGVVLMNNCRYTLGMSVWSEVSSQALEISSKLISPTVWVNCHGEFDAGVPLQLSGFSGNCVLGGSDGILEYTSVRVNDSVDGLPNSGDGELNYEMFQGGNGKNAILAQKAFMTWQQNKNRRFYLKEIAKSLSLDSSTAHLYDIIHYYAHSGYLTNFLDRSSTEEFEFVKKKIPVGVILLVINTDKIDNKSIVSLFTPALALGNAVMVVLKKEDLLLQSIIKSFMKILPKNLLSVFIGLEHGVHFASDPNIQAVWLYDETGAFKDFLQTIRKHSARNLKRFWIVPAKIPISQILFQKECLQNKVVWLTKIDQFP